MLIIIGLIIVGIVAAIMMLNILTRFFRTASGPQQHAWWAWIAVILIISLLMIRFAP